MAYTNLNIPRLANGALESFIKGLAPLMAFSTKFIPDAAPNTRTHGNAVLVPLVGTLTATTFGGTYAITTFAKSVVTVTINKHKVVHIGQQDLDALDNSDSALESFGYQQGGALAQAVVEEILKAVTTATANFAQAAVTTSTSFDVYQLRQGRLKLNQSNTPFSPRSILIDAPAMDALLAVTNFVQAQMFADNQVLKEGRIMRALGFDFYELNGSFVSTYSVNAFVCHPAAIAVAMRYVAPQNPGRYDNAEQFTDPRTGATFGLRDVYDPLTGTRYMALECNFGYSVGLTYAGRVLNRAD